MLGEYAIADDCKNVAKKSSMSLSIRISLRISLRFARCWLGSVHGNHSGRMFDNIVHFNFGDAGQMTYNWNKYQQNKKLTST